MSQVIAIAAGPEHSLALQSSGTVAAWGNNTYGQSTVPSGLNNVVAISAGQSHSVALKNNGKVVAWGKNWYGESLVPTVLNQVGAIVAAGDRTLALGAAMPSLQTETSGTNLNLIWPDWAADSLLETSEDLCNPNSWIPVTNLPTTANFMKKVTLGISSNNHSFRLRRQ